MLFRRRWTRGFASDHSTGFHRGQRDAMRAFRSVRYSAHDRPRRPVRRAHRDLAPRDSDRGGHGRRRRQLRRPVVDGARAAAAESQRARHDVRGKPVLGVRADGLGSRLARVARARARRRHLRRREHRPVSQSRRGRLRLPLRARCRRVRRRPRSNSKRRGARASISPARSTTTASAPWRSRASTSCTRSTPSARLRRARACRRRSCAARRRR